MCRGKGKERSRGMRKKGKRKMHSGWLKKEVERKEMCRQEVK